LADFLRAVPGAKVGHALVTDALELGYDAAVRITCAASTTFAPAALAMIYGIGTDICDIRRIRQPGAPCERFCQSPRRRRTGDMDRRAPAGDRGVSYCQALSGKPSARRLAWHAACPLTWRHCPELPR
jgi:hypothetical protein